MKEIDRSKIKVLMAKEEKRFTKGHPKSKLMFKRATVGAWSLTGTRIESGSKSG